MYILLHKEKLKLYYMVWCTKYYIYFIFYVVKLLLRNIIIPKQKFNNSETRHLNFDLYT